MIIKYVTGSFMGSDLIQAVEVEKETDKSVWMRGRRIAKESNYENYHNTWDEAKSFLMAKANNVLLMTRRRLELAQGHYGNVKGLKPPQEHNGEDK